MTVERLPRHKYTKQQMLLLAERFPDNPITRRISYCIRSYYKYRRGICTSTVGPNPRSLWYSNFEDYFRLRYNSLYKLMYKVPFEKLPFYVSTDKPIARAVIKWRLEIGQ